MSLLEIKESSTTNLKFLAFSLLSFFNLINSCCANPVIDFVGKIQGNLFFGFVVIIIVGCLILANIGKILKFLFFVGAIIFVFFWLWVKGVFSVVF